MSLPGMKYDLHCAVGSKARIGTRIKSAKKLETRALLKNIPETHLLRQVKHQSNRSKSSREFCFTTWPIRKEWEV